MTKSIRKILMPTALYFCAAIAAAFGQARLNPFSIKPSTLLEEARNLKIRNPKITAEDLAERANALLASEGVNFIFDFDPATCQKIADARRNPKNAGAPVRLNARLQSFDGETAAVVLPESRTEQGECGICSVALPVLEIASGYFVTTIQNRNIKFHTPPNFTANEIFLVDPKSPSAVIRSWKIPFRAAPLSISEDGKIIFLDLPFAELKDIALSVYENGAMQFYAKSEFDSEAKLSPAADIAKQAGQPNYSFLSVGAGEKLKVLKLAAPCR